MGPWCSSSRKGKKDRAKLVDIERLVEQSSGPELSRFIVEPSVPERGDENDRGGPPRAAQSGQHCETGVAWHPHVADDRIGPPERGGAHLSQPLEEFETIAKLADLVAVGTQLFRQERSHVSVVVGDEDVPEGGAGRRMTNLSKRLKQDPKLGPCLST